VKKIFPISILATLVFGLILSACASTAVTPTAPDQDAIYTAAAQTLAFDMTMNAGNTAVARLTEMAFSPSPAPPSATFTPEPSATPEPPSPTPPPPSPTITSTRCDWAEFVGDVSVRDNEGFPPGVEFTKTWRLRNIGSCTWTSEYYLVFGGGDGIGGNPLNPLPGIVRPGETVDLSIDLRAPATPGSYRGNWLLRNPDGVAFGIGPNAQDTFWVQIQVQDLTQSSQYDYDFAANYCLATWDNQTNLLRCPGSSGDQDGFVILLQEPRLETRIENELALWTRPSAIGNGWIIGEYPPYRVEDGDRFVADIGCLEDSSDCDVRFHLDYRTSGGTVRSLGIWREVYDNNTTRIDQDLSDLAGLTVQFILSVRNLGDIADANAFWFVPHIRNDIILDKILLTWGQEQANACNELDVYIASPTSGEARAYSCLNGRAFLGRTTLTNDELDQFITWNNIFRSFSGEIFKAEPFELTFISINGDGNNDAKQSDIENISIYAEGIFRRINP